MSNFNHNRPQLKIVDNIKHEIAELDSRFKPYGISGKEKVSALFYDDSIKRPISAVDRKTHTTACTVLAHIHKYREVALGNKLINSLKGMRKTAVIAWFCEFGETTDMNHKTKKRCLKLFFSKHCETRQSDAEAKPFWEYFPPIRMN
jgi:hypothetical protein